MKFAWETALFRTVNRDVVRMLLPAFPAGSEAPITASRK